MKLIDADMGDAELRILYDAWNLAMAPAEGREIAYVDKNMRIIKLMRSFLASMPEVETAKPTNEPLSLEELRQMDGEPVWCAGMQEWRIVYVDRENRLIRLYSVFNTVSADHIFRNDGRIYPSKPKEANHAEG